MKSTIGLKLMALGLLFMLAGLVSLTSAVVVEYVVRPYFPEAWDELEKQQITQYIEQAALGGCAAYVIGMILALNVHGESRTTKGLLLGLLLTVGDFALWVLGTFRPELLPPMVVPYLSAIYVGVFLFSIIVFLNTFRRLAYWMEDFPLETMGWRAYQMTIIAWLFWVGRIAIQEYQPEWFEKIEPIDRFSGPEVAKLAVGAFVVLAIVLFANVLFTSARALLSCRYRDEEEN